MQFRTYTTLLLCLAGFSFCKNDPKTAEKETPKNAPDTVRVQPVSQEGATPYIITEGTVYWVGRKATGSEHNGTINCSGGELLVNQGQVLIGSVDLDMNSVSVLDLKDPGEKKDLEKHLRDGDFFDTKKYPKATFSIEESLPSNLPEFNAVLSGKLTMKDKSNPVNIPVKLQFSDDTFTAESTAFIINRTLWGVNFRSGILGTAQDKMIDDGVRLAIKVKGKKK